MSVPAGENWARIAHRGSSQRLAGSGRIGLSAVGAPTAAPGRRQAFAKLGMRSRVELARLVSAKQNAAI